MNRKLPAPTLQALAVSGVFLVVQLFLVQHHEMWRDELQAWLIARDSDGLFQLFGNMRYEGHPALWHVLLMPLTRLFDGPEAMQVAHVLIASGSVFLLMRYAPFNLRDKLLLCTGYFLFYEYAQIARNYAPGVFLAFLFCAVFPHRGRHVIALAVILFLLAQTSVFGAILSLVLGMALITQRWLDGAAGKDRLAIPAREGVAAAIILAGLAVCIIQMMPPPDSGFATGWFFHFDRERLPVLVTALTGSYLPFPVLDEHYWGTLWLLPSPSFDLARYAVLAVMIPIVAIFVAALRNTPAALMVFVLVTAGCLLFFYVKYPGSIRHHGFLFVALIVSLWIAPSCTGPANGPVEAGRGALRPAALLFTMILLVHTAAGLSAAVLDVRYTFSQAQNAARAIAAAAGPDDILVGIVDTPVSAVAGYLHREIYYVKGDRSGTFIRLDQRRLSVHGKNLPDFARDLDHGKTLFAITNEPLDFTGAKVTFRTVFASDTAVVKDEIFYVYKISR